MAKKIRFKRKRIDSLHEESSPFIHHGETRETTNVPFFSSSSGTQAKLSISKSNDPQEKQADAIADKVVKRGKTTNTSSVGSMTQLESEEKSVQSKLSRQEEEEAQTKLHRKEKEEEPVQSKLQRQEEEVQEKLQKQEEEDEGVQSRLQRQEEEEEPIQTRSIQRKEMVDTAQRDIKLTQVKENSPGKDSGTASTSFESRVNKQKSGGVQLPENIRKEMEQNFGVSFSNVRIHTGDDAADLCNEINAVAFTQGYHIFFNAGKFQPQTSAGKHLLTHELTHVVQQNELD